MDQPNLAKNEAPLYLCSQCNEAVFLVEGIVYRPCGHKDVPVLANLEAMVSGRGTAQ